MHTIGTIRLYVEVFFLKVKWKTLVICLAIPLIAGTLSGALAGNSMEIFENMKKPPLSPPGWVFPVVWTILYLLMGIASYLIAVSSQSTQRIQALRIYGWQLFVNFLWPVLFFQKQWYWFSFFWLVLLWYLILTTIIHFGKISKDAAKLMIPYLLWVTFAGYLNLWIAVS